jgi:hypothetical protein
LIAVFSKQQCVALGGQICDEALLGAPIRNGTGFTARTDAFVLGVALAVELPIITGFANDKSGGLLPHCAPLVVEAAVIADRPHVEDGHYGVPAIVFSGDPS